MHIVAGAGENGAGFDGGGTAVDERVIAHAAGDVKRLAGRIEDEPIVGIGNGHNLLLNRRPLGYVVDKDVLFRTRVVDIRGIKVDVPAVGSAERIVNAVEPAGKNQQRIAVRAHGGADRLAHLPGGILGQNRRAGHQRLEGGVKRGQGRNLLPHVGYLLRRGRGSHHRDVQDRRRAAARVDGSDRVAGRGSRRCRISADDSRDRAQVQAGWKRRAHAVGDHRSAAVGRNIGRDLRSFGVNRRAGRVAQRGRRLIVHRDGQGSRRAAGRVGGRNRIAACCGHNRGGAAYNSRAGAQNQASRKGWAHAVGGNGPAAAPGAVRCDRHTFGKDRRAGGVAER